ncbi:cell wall-binding repeat-containing protein [Desulfitobacterium chlororespirans]|uniref:Putative cell wall binding repeat 2 n=1 Tax=Desulfitobacterium chlororespirans DSM 11544 TaxID=1121395 RepID=A0A1M7U902_9FIRM|nr:cell wall-binding repeat-containing protein [Desulfitobacterium chlororespirans]SHN79521.1 Putative cell wall binding repeat 2 [Desulfitobacterium chlororespirans DSM 11544]
MKKTKKALASLAIAGMVLSMAPISVFAADEDTRLAGADRYLTSIKIAEKAYASADTAVVAAGNPNNLVDALAAAPLAAQEDAPIYLTDKADMNDDVVKSMKALGVDKVIVVGAAASKAVVDELKAAGFTVEEVKGAGRVETAEAINAKLTAPAGTFVVGYDGVADAMSVASFAAANNYAIVVTNQNGMANGTVEADYIVGGTTRVKDIAGAKRLAGADRYDTNKQVIAELDFDFGKVYVGNGLTLADALVGSVLAAQTNSPIALTDGKTVKADIASNLDADSVIVALGGTAAVSNAVIDAVKNPPSDGVFAVDTVSAVAADVFAVNFTKAPADASKITFEVKQGTAPVTVSATWDGAKAALKKSSKFIAGTYTVVVKEGEKELANKEITVSEQKVAKIEITSSKLGVVSKTTDNETVQTGYATYKVLDQYGVDITNMALGQNVQFQTGVGSIEASKGLIKVTPSTGLNLLTFSGGVVITANDTTSGVSTTATLATSSQIGTLSDIVLTTLTNADGKELTAGDSTTVFYLGYEATDLSGNPTTNYELVKQGLIFQGGENSTNLTSSSPNVTAELVQDPKDSTKAAIRVTASDERTLVDQPVIITAMTWTGKNSQFNTTLKKQAEVYTFNLYAPAEAIASGESKEIPFVAYDQNNVQITKFSDLDGKVKLTGAYLDRNVDGTAVVKNDRVTNNTNSSIPAVISASVIETGKFSTITINIQKTVKADGLEFDSSVVKTNLQAGGASQKADFGYDKGGFTVKDQYGREIDMTTAAASDYKIRVKSDAPTVINATVTGGDADGNLTTGESQVVFTSGAAGSTTVRFELLDVNNKVVDSKSLTFSSVKDTDIKDYSIDELSKVVYGGTAKRADNNYTDQEKGWNASPKVYGKTSSGALVVLKGTPVVSAKSTSGDFYVYGGATGGAYDSVKVLATKPADLAKTGATGTISVTVKGADGYLYPVSTAIESSTAGPKAESVSVEVATEQPGVERDNDVVTLTADPASGRTIASLLGPTLAKFQADGSKGTQNVYFQAKDQYGKTASNLAYYSLLSEGTSLTKGSIVTVAANGEISGTFVPGDYITVSATTTTNLVKNVKIVFATTGTTPGDTTAPVVTGVEDGKTYSAAVTPASTDTDIATVVLTKGGTAVDGYALGTAISENGAYVLTVTDNAGNKTEISFTIDSESKVLTGDFQDVLGVKFVDVTLPAGVTAVDGVAKDGVAVTEGTGYTVEGSKLTIVDVTDANVITVTIGDDVYTVVK